MAASVPREIFPEFDVSYWGWKTSVNRMHPCTPSASSSSLTRARTHKITDLAEQLIGIRNQFVLGLGSAGGARGNVARGCLLRLSDGHTQKTDKGKDAAVKLQHVRTKQGLSCTTVSDAIAQTWLDI